MSKISPFASLENSKLYSSHVSIGKDARLTDVEIKAREITVKSGAVLTGCKIFSDGNIVIGQGTYDQRTDNNQCFQVSIHWQPRYYR